MMLADHSRMPDFEHKLAHFSTMPLVLAVEFLHGTTWWPGRAAEFVQDEAGWHIGVSPEQNAYRSGARGGWLSPDLVRPGQHHIRTTFPGPDWLLWTGPVQWPADLAFLDRSASNLHERPDR